MSKIYVFSGLGADERVFQKMDFSGLTPVFIDWISPHGDEAIESYAERISRKIKEPDPVLVGLSFGGIMAVEVARQMKVRKVILIASAKHKYEIPGIYRLAGSLGIVNLLPAKLLKRSNRITDWLFGAETDFERKLLRQILKDTDPVFMKWAVRKISCWELTSKTKNLIHIHGTRDRILPFRKVKCDIPVSDGGHFMTLSHADEISKILKKCVA